MSNRALGPALHPAGYRRPLSHTITDCRLRRPSWVLCECGELVKADNPKAVEVGFVRHRREVGLRTPSLAESSLNHRAFS